MFASYYYYKLFNASKTITFDYSLVNRDFFIPHYFRGLLGENYSRFIQKRALSIGWIGPSYM